MVALGCSKKRPQHPVKLLCVLVFAIFPIAFSFHIESDVGLVDNDIIITFSLMTTKLPPNHSMNPV